MACQNRSLHSGFHKETHRHDNSIKEVVGSLSFHTSGSERGEKKNLPASSVFLLFGCLPEARQCALCFSTKVSLILHTAARLMWPQLVFPGKSVSKSLYPFKHRDCTD